MTSVAELPADAVPRGGIGVHFDPRVINVEFGWWFPERKDREHGVWDSNANVLTNIEPPYDPAMGTYQLRALLCRIEKVGAAGPDRGYVERGADIAQSADASGRVGSQRR